MMTRRRLFAAAAGFLVPRWALAGSPGLAVIRMRATPDGAEAWFDPAGLVVRPGDTVRWVVDSGVHTATAYHPRNAGHSLRIPETAEPWDSGYLVNPGDHFAVRLTVEGVYDYFCRPHEMAGMVGRIVVGRAAGPGAGPFDASVPAAARRVLARALDGMPP